MTLDKFQLAAFVVCLGFAATAADVSIDAKGGVLADDSEAVYRIDSATGTGDGIQLGARVVHAAGIVQEQDEVDAVVKMASEQILVLGSVAVQDVMKGLTIGETRLQGNVMASSTTVPFEIFVANSAAGQLTFNANVVLTNSAGKFVGPWVRKTGSGFASFMGDFSVAVTNEAGVVNFYDISGREGVVVSGEGAVYAVSSADGGKDVFAQQFKANALDDVRGPKTEYGSIDATALTGFNVFNGSWAHCRGAKFFSIDVAQDPETHLVDVPDCCVIAADSVGVLELDAASSYRGKLVIGGANGSGSGHSLGALYLRDHSEVVNYTATNGEWAIGRSGYAYVEVSGASTYTAAGKWQGGQFGQLAIVVTNGTFRHTASSERLSGFGLGGNGGIASLYIGAGGLFDAAESGSWGYAPAQDASSGIGQITVENGGRMSLGTNSLVLGSTSVLNVNEGGRLTVGSVRGNGGAPLVQFDGGTLAVSVSSTNVSNVFEGDCEVMSQGKGATIEVPAGVTVALGRPMETPSAGKTKCLTAIEVPSSARGKKFVGPPVAKLSARGATAVCELDENREVKAIHVTGRGVCESGCGGSLEYGNKTYGFANTDATLDWIVSGGLTKTGAGTLVLDQKNTCTGETAVAGGTLVVSNKDAIVAGCPLRLSNGGVLDLYNHDTIDKGYRLVCSDLKGDGSGRVVNGTVDLMGLKVDLNEVKAMRIDTLNLTNVMINAAATIKLENATDLTLDREKEYVLYEFSGPVPERMPPIDPETYANGLSEAWAVAVRGNKAVLIYFGGSYFIYY